jgi:tRNA (cmo5U34)-methyltransferase
MQKSHSKLTFSFASFAEGFDDHIQKSIRGYRELLDDCVAMSEYFVENETRVFDIGCSTGRFLSEMWGKNRERAPRAKYVGIDIEANFTACWRRLKVDNVEFHVADVRSFPIPERCSLVTSLFSLQFIAERDRQKIVDRIFQALVPGGALIVAEKTLSKCSKLQNMLTFVHYDYKRQSFTEAEVLEKERSLRAIMKPWLEEQIVQSLSAAGFCEANVQPFWRNHSFAAFIALR